VPTDIGTVIVTGGASGLGAATARRLAGAGANVTIADVQAEKGQALAEEIGGRFVEVDVTKPEMVEQAVNTAAEDGPLRISVTCAGVGWAQKTAGSKGVHPVEPFQVVLNINLVGTFNVLRLAAQKMIESGADDGEERGVIINTASIAAYDGQIGQIAYAASKGGVVGLTLPAARDLSRDHIRVVTIAPGLFDTPLLAALPEEARTKLGQSVPHPARLGSVEEYAHLAQHIIENPMLNGEVIRLDGALRMAPR
jgi:NAD(P)-dependent dehydrogenase (short-subunit alcohol dehydrogenase family)